MIWTHTLVSPPDFWNNFAFLQEEIKDGWSINLKVKSDYLRVMRWRQLYPWFFFFFQPYLYFTIYFLEMNMYCFLSLEQLIVLNHKPRMASGPRALLIWTTLEGEVRWGVEIAGAAQAICEELHGKVRGQRGLEWTETTGQLKLRSGEWGSRCWVDLDFVGSSFSFQLQ